MGHADGDPVDVVKGLWLGPRKTPDLTMWGPRKERIISHARLEERKPN